MMLFEKRCVTSCPPTPPCSCEQGQVCFQTARSCDACPANTCIAGSSSAGDSGSVTTKPGSVSKGALAGAVIGVLIFLAAAVGLVLWYRRANRYKFSANQRMVPHVKDIPAPAATVLSRPDPTEKSTQASTVTVFSSPPNANLRLQSEPHRPHGTALTSAAVPNPFEDNQSIQTTGTEGTNVIPIALVPPDSQQVAQAFNPVRPVRSPELTLNYNLEHVNVSSDPIRPHAAPSQVSGISGVSSRNSYMSSASFSSDFLNEAPMIVTANKSDVRQVLGVVKPEVINATAVSPTTAEGLKPPSAFAKRPSTRSPLSSTSFGPLDMIKDSDDERSISDPFDDRHCSTVTNLASPSASVTTFGQPSPAQSRDSQWDTPALAYTQESRPSSTYTQAGSVIVGIGNATRVNLGLSYATDDAHQSANYPRSLYRTTMGRLVTPSTAAATVGSLEEQQQSALALAQAHAEVDLSRRLSGSSVLSTSTRADSILESFPFVPPSPISNRPMRTPPVSPLGQVAFGAATNPSSPLAKQTFSITQSANGGASDEELPAPPNRRTLGLSTGSQLSTASSGLGSFPFQIESGNDAEIPSASYGGRQRASLDTLAITSDLTSYPLGFDRDSAYKPN